MLLYIWLAAIIAASWLYLRQTFSRFSKYGVKNIKPTAFFRNVAWMLLKKEHFAEEIDRSYNEFPEERFIGRFEVMNAVVLVRDIDLLKKITVKDFEYFIDHRSIINEKTDPLFGRILISLKGEEWKDMRSTLSPAFTSSKIRVMVPFMVDVGNQMMESLKTKILESNNNYIDVDCKDLTTRYANDVVASCAFGLKVDSHTEQDNEFYQMGKSSVTFDTMQVFKFIGFLAFPKLMEKLRVTIFTEEAKAFFRNLVNGTMKDREEKHIIRPDMIHLLMEAKKGKLVYDDKANDTDTGFATVEESVVGKKTTNRDWSNDDLVAQAVLFFIAGFETVSSAMSFALHEVAVNPEVQEKLVKEIMETDRKNGGKFDYNSIQKMTYMDMVVSEVLRLWPPAINLDRMCAKDYNFGKPNSSSSQDFVIHAGEGIVVPVFSIHRDPRYFPDPLKFDPERFSEENKHQIQPFTYMPFGMGPRNCIGSRFALCEMKVMLYQLLKHMELSPNEKTCIPAVLDPGTFNFSIKGGHWLRMKIRN